MEPEKILKIKRKFRRDKSMQFLRNCLEAIGNEERSTILDLQNSKPYKILDLEDILNKSTSSISHHIKILERQGLISGKREGKYIYYYLSKYNFQKMDNIWTEWFSNILSG